MNQIAELEIGLHRREADTYAVEFRFSLPDSEAEVRLGQGIARFDTGTLATLAPGEDLYGQTLTKSLFADAAVQTAFAQAFASVQSQELTLRLRIFIGPSATELNNLHWESLRNPLDDTPLATNENILFSRYLTSLDWRPIHLRPKSSLRALVVIANPKNLSEYQNLAPIDVEGELNRARQGLGTIPVTPLPPEQPPADGKPPLATLNNLVEQLRQESHDILYLVCHGMLSNDEPYLWLEDDEGKAAITPGQELVTRLNELEQRPRLVVLASCQSAGNATQGDALNSLGPRLVQAGIPAVLAMQGNISLETLAGFMPVFFKEVQQEGLVDQATAVARSAVQQRPDHWMPALFMRLKSGRIWYVPGFGKEQGGFDLWRPLFRSISNNRCTPIIGPGLYESLIGSQREIARKWAEAYHYPMQPHERESLAQVAQFLTINLYRSAPYDELREYLKDEIWERFGAELPPEITKDGTSLDDLMGAAGAIRRKKQPAEPYKVLAQLPLAIYITTNSNNLLAQALKEAGKDPQVAICPWNEATEQMKSIYDTEPGYQPTPQRPLVYHLFGRLNEPESIVLTEDDYFNFLIGVTRNRDQIPKDVLEAWVNSALLFVGFQLDDWQFRVLFHSLLDQQGSLLRGRYPHVAVQIEPEEGRILEPERARRYLEAYFAKGAEISLYWGSTEDFITELLAGWQQLPA
jgi:hypothetical protein